MATEDTLQIIFEKWSHIQIPSSVQNDIREACDPLKDCLFGFIEMNFKLGIIEKDKLSRFGEDIGEIIAKLAMHSLMLGLEFGTKGPLSEVTDSVIRDKVQEALPIFKIARIPASRYGMQLLSNLGAVNSDIKRNLESHNKDFVSIIFSTMVKCFRIGLIFSNQIN